jgi:hypothetical protein
MWLDRVVTANDVDERDGKKKKFPSPQTDKNYSLSSFLIRFMVQVVGSRRERGMSFC